MALTIHSNSSNWSLYEESQKDLRQARIWRVSSDKARKILWTLFLGFACYLIGGELPIGVYGKILKDLLSLEKNIDKLLKCLVPAWTLIKTWNTTNENENQATADPEPDHLGKLVDMVSTLDQYRRQGNCQAEIKAILKEISGLAEREKVRLQQQELDGATEGGSASPPN